MSFTYTPNAWVNNTTPAISAANLLKIENALVKLAGSGASSGVEAQYVTTTDDIKLQPAATSTILWTDASDGAGSGLDADKFDGIQSTSFAYTYDAGRTYGSGETCLYAGDIYKSLQAGNSAKTPGTQPLWWQLTSSYISTHLVGSTVGTVPWQSGTDTTSWVDVATASAGYILSYTGASSPAWIAPNTMAINKASNLAGGAAGKIPYQSALDTTLFSAAGTSGQVLLSGGTGSPTWSNTITGATISGGSISATTSIGATSGASLTSLNASNISSGTIGNTYLPATISVTNVVASTRLNIPATASTTDRDIWIA